MVRYIFLTCFIVLLASASPHVKQSLKDIGGRIFNGQNATLGQFPWHVGLLVGANDGVRFCGGALISEEWILTAGHCVDGLTIAYVYMGCVDLNLTPELAVTDMFILHENYNATTIANDLGLIHLRKPLIFDEYTSAAALPSEPLESGVEMIVSGWGDTSEGSLLSEILNYVAVTTMDNNECAETYGEIIDDGMVCASTGPCNGDDGDPAIVYNDDGNSVLVGIASFQNDRNCESGNPSRYTRTASYRNWIKEKIGI